MKWMFLSQRLLHIKRRYRINEKKTKMKIAPIWSGFFLLFILLTLEGFQTLRGLVTKVVCVSPEASEEKNEGKFVEVDYEIPPKSE
jgi:hypothetical protein